MRLKKNNVYLVRISQDARKLLEELGHSQGGIYVYSDDLP